MANPLTVEDEIVAALRRIIRAVDLHSRHLVHEVGLTWPQLATLRAAERLGDCSIGALARAVHLSQPTLTGIVQRLERAGYVRRSPHKQDGRSVTITITPTGRNLLEKAPSLLQDRFHGELAKLKDWERFQTLASLQRIAEMMDVEALDASPILVAGPMDPRTVGTQAETVSSEVAAEALALPEEREPKKKTNWTTAKRRNGARNS
jgi:DNA-binding MarR family transcriptional regulator